MIAGLSPSLAIALTVGLLVLSNLFMTFAWYGHLKSPCVGAVYFIFRSA